MNITKKQLQQIVKEEVNKLLREGMEAPHGEAMLDMVYDSEPGDLIYYGISALKQMQAEILRDILEAEKEYHEMWSGYGNSDGFAADYAEDNIVPLQQSHDKITKAIEIAMDMGFEGS